MMRDFKAILGFEDYLIFRDGRVFSFKTNKYLKPRNNTKGYYQVVLSQPEKKYIKYIARLVAQAFIPNPDNKPEINHIDGDKANNNVYNLEWVTRSENMLHAYSNGLQTPLPGILVRVYDYKTGKFLSVEPSLSEAERSYRIPHANIRRVLAGRQNHTRGLTFIKVLK